MGLSLAWRNYTLLLSFNAMDFFFKHATTETKQVLYILGRNIFSSEARLKLLVKYLVYIIY